jgi:hypothetical protein
VITGNTSWRDLPPISYEGFRAVLERANSPLLAHAASVYDATSHPLLLLGLLARESRFGTSAWAAATLNPLNLRPRPFDQRPTKTHPRDGAFLVFSFVDEFAIEFDDRVGDPAYKGGVYVKNRTLREFLVGNDETGHQGWYPYGDGANDPPAYLDALLADLNFWTKEEDDVPTPPTIYDLNTLAGVAAYNRRYPDATLSSAELDDLLVSRVAFHTGRPEGICLHVQEGQTKWSIKEHATTARDASANAYLNLDGSIVLAVSRSFGAWTQGIKTSGPGASHPSARGAQFLAWVGTADANEAVLSIEYEGDDQGPHPPAQLQSGAWLIREWQRLNPQIGNDDIFRHADFDVVHRSHCPGWLYDETMKLLKAAPSDPPPPAYSHKYPPGYDAALCSEIWSSLYAGDDVPQFDPTVRGTVSKLWVESLILSPIVLHVKDTGGREIFHFASGEAIGRLTQDEKFRVLI